MKSYCVIWTYKRDNGKQSSEQYLGVDARDKTQARKIAIEYLRGFAPKILKIEFEERVYEF